MNTSKQGKNRTISKKILYSLIVLALAICISVSTLVAILYFNNQIQEYGKTAFALARATADSIDGDRIQGYLDTLETDAYYDEIQASMDRYGREFDLLYYYVFTVVGDKEVYLWSADSGEAALGYTEEAPSPEDFQIALEMMSGQRTVDFLVNYTPQYGLLGTSWVPIHDSAGNVAAVVGVDYSMPVILRMIMLFAVAVTVVVAAVTALGGYIYYRSVKKNIIRPIELLNHAAGELVDNLEKDVAFHVDIHTGDELEALADAFGKMDQGLRKYIHELAHVTAEKERVDADLRMASRIQLDALPPVAPEFANHLDLNLRGSMNTAKEVGGDFFDYFPIDDNRICFLIADVSGKGTPAALFMMTAKTMIKDYALNLDSTSEIFTAVNARLCENNDAGMFATAWIGIVDTRTMTLQYTNAGHNYPLLQRKGQPCEIIKKNHGLFLAGMEFTQYKQSELQLASGDRLLLYTDGVVEAHDRDNELYGDDRLKSMLDGARDLPGEQVLERIFDDVNEYAAGVPQFDDITMVVLTIK